MRLFQFSLDPNPSWDRACLEHRALFHSVRWQQLLESAFDCRSIYGWEPVTRSGLAISVFRAGPFRIGYLGLPIGGIVGTTPLHVDTVNGWEATQFPLRVDCIRIPVSGFGPTLDLAVPAAENPETVICNLTNWSIGDIPKLRRDINKAQRSAILIEDVDKVTMGDTFASFYRETVTRHRGRLRYNERYFRLLIELSREHSCLRCLVAKSGPDIAGFVIAAIHMDAAYYLHGASSPAFRQYGASDLLLLEAIHWAKSQSVKHFNLLTSPPGQTSLIRYKEKWGARTLAHRTYTLPLNSAATRLFLIGENIHRKLTT